MAAIVWCVGILQDCKGEWDHIGPHLDLLLLNLSFLCFFPACLNLVFLSQCARMHIHTHMHAQGSSQDRDQSTGPDQINKGGWTGVSGVFVCLLCVCVHVCVWSLVCMCVCKLLLLNDCSVGS